MSWLFFLDPRIIVSAASVLGGLYFLSICIEDTKTLWLFWRKPAQASQARFVFKANLGPTLPDDRFLSPYPLPPQGG